ncbi:MAG: phospholipase A2, partial [Actinomycetota bacterium]
LTVFPSAHTALAVANNAANDSAYVQHLVFNVPLSQFSDTARARIGLQGTAGDTWFDWSTDLCSAPLVGNTGRTFNFTEPCRRHDFAYRNTQLLERRYGGGGQFWNSASRKRIDLQFLDDTKAHCASRSIFDRPTCYAWAYTFYGAVRLVAGP